MRQGSQPGNPRETAPTVIETPPKKVTSRESPKSVASDEPGAGMPGSEVGRRCDLRPIRKLRVRKLRIADSEFLGNSLWTWEFHPLKFRICFSCHMFYCFSQFFEIYVSLQSLQKQPKTAPNLFQRGDRIWRGEGGAASFPNVLSL